MPKFLLDILTCKDGESHDVGRYFAVLSCISAVGFQGWAVIHDGQYFDMQNFGIGVGALATGVGALLKLKENTEP